MVAVSIPSIHEELFGNGANLTNTVDLFGDDSDLRFNDPLPAVQDSGQGLLPQRQAFGTAVNYKAAIASPSISRNSGDTDVGSVPSLNDIILASSAAGEPTIRPRVGGGHDCPAKLDESKVSSITLQCRFPQRGVTLGDAIALIPRMASGRMRHVCLFDPFDITSRLLGSSSSGTNLHSGRANTTSIWNRCFSSPRICLVHNSAFFTIRVCTFDPETAQLTEMAGSLEDWAQAILEEFDVQTGYPLGNEWQTQHQPLSPGTRLLPKTPFVVGGQFEVDNLYSNT